MLAQPIALQTLAHTAVDRFTPMHPVEVDADRTRWPGKHWYACVQARYQPARLATSAGNPGIL